MDILQPVERVPPFRYYPNFLIRNVPRHRVPPSYLQVETGRYQGVALGVILEN